MPAKNARDRETNKSAAIRAILSKHGPLDIYALQEQLETKLQQIVGRQVLYTLLSVMQANDGDVRGTGRGRERLYALVATPTNRRRAA